MGKGLWAYYLKDACSGEPYTPLFAELGYNNFTSAQGIYFAAEDLWYASGGSCAEAGPMQWGWDPLLEECKESDPLDLCVLRPIPPEIQNLLPNPPYTMAVEY